MSTDEKKQEAESLNEDAIEETAPVDEQEDSTEAEAPEAREAIEESGSPETNASEPVDEPVALEDDEAARNPNEKGTKKAGESIDSLKAKTLVEPEASKALGNRIFNLIRTLGLNLVSWLEVGILAALVASLGELLMVAFSDKHDWGMSGGISAAFLTILAALVLGTLPVSALLWGGLSASGIVQGPAALAHWLCGWLKDRAPGRVASRISFLVAVVVMAPLAIAAVYKVLPKTSTLFATPRYNFLLQSVAALSIGVMALLAGRSLRLGLRPLLELLLRRVGIARLVIGDMRRVLGLALVLLGLAYGVVAVYFVRVKGLDISLAFLWLTVGIYSLSLLPLARAIAAFNARFGNAAIAGRILLVGSVALGATIGLTSSSETQSGLHVISRSGALTQPLARMIRKITDIDRDGYSSLMGGGDCAPRNKNVNPGAQEILENGIDDNCIGGDLTLDKVPQAPEPDFIDNPLCAEKGCDFLFVSVDALRYDRLGAYGYERNISPTIDTIAADGTRFDHAYCIGPGTILAIPQLFTMRYDTQLVLNESKRRALGPRPLAHSNKLFPQYLQDAGYETYGVVGNHYLECLRYGFKTYSNPRDKWAYDQDITAPDLTERAIKAYDELSRKKAPFFLWVHYFDPHHNYMVHDPAFDGSDSDRYDGEIAFTDEWFSKLLEHIEANPRQRPLIIAITADHGEGLGQHGIKYHNENFYNELCRLPLIFMVPGAPPRVIQGPVSAMDIGPTFLNLAGVDPPLGAEGKSLAGQILNGEEELDRVVFHQALYHQRGIDHEHYGLSTSEWRLFWDRRNNTRELYAISDEEELENKADREKAVLSRLMEIMDGFIYRVEKD